VPTYELNKSGGVVLKLHRFESPSHTYGANYAPKLSVLSLIRFIMGRLAIYFLTFLHLLMT